ncbi:MAG: NAD(P)/FAD-dependent oxidoreductase [Bacteroidia bacterium]|nr:NAD(P)/FAD-dependent oxidoreductase [Bacteroidia bacterium]
MKAVVPMTNKPRLLIIGGGFGGITLAKTLRNSPFQIVMIDKHNYHTFQPLLYQVATGGLEPDSIAFPLRKIFKNQENFIFRMATVESVDTTQNTVYTNIGEIHYDYLVLATGSATNFFGMKDLEKEAVGMKSIPEALDLRSLILQNFETALQQSNGEIKDVLLKFVVVGGGPTGVETSGALAELKRHVLPSDYPELDLRQMEIHLLEAGDQLLAGMSAKSSTDAKTALEKLGVHVWLNTMVTGYDGTHVSTNLDRQFEASTVIWAAGVKGNLIEGLGKEIIERGNRLAVDEFNKVKGYSNVFAIGDLALMRTEDYPNGHPQVAPAAIQQGERLGKNLMRTYKKREQVPFAYFDKGSMATIGRNKAVVDFRKLHLRGFVAWLGWMFVHILYLIGFRNRLVVFVNWVWSYFTYDKGTRLIIRPFRKKEKTETVVV